MTNLFKSEPAVVVSTITAFLGAIIGVFIAFGADISEEQKQSVLYAVGPCVGVIFLLGFLIRGMVYSPDTYGSDVATAHQAGEKDETLQIQTK